MEKLRKALESGSKVIILDKDTIDLFVRLGYFSKKGSYYVADRYPGVKIREQILEEV